MIRVDILEKFGVVAGMSDRSDGDCSLQDDPACRDNRVRVVASCGLDGTTLVGARQFHGCRIARVDQRYAGNGLSRTAALANTDGLATGERGLVLTVTVADCVPLFLVNPLANVVSLVHAGRVGTESGIAMEAMRVMAGMGASAAEMYAYIGPSAGPCCYEVDATMAGALRAASLIVHGRHVDLWESNVWQLVKSGIDRERIIVDGRCTICHGAFHSHRTHADSQRNMAFLALK